MAHWHAPSYLLPSDYELDGSSPVPGAVSTLRVTELTWSGNIYLYGKGDDWKVVSSDTSIVPDNGIFVGSRGDDGNTVVSLWGRFPNDAASRDPNKKCLIHAGTGTFGTPSWSDGTKPLKVEVRTWMPRLFALELCGYDPMALNSHDTPLPYKMKHTKTYAKDCDIYPIFDDVVAAGKNITHLAFSCHGLRGQILIAGLHSSNKLDDSNVDLFSRLKDRVRNIWVVACTVCGGGTGDSFVQAIADKSGCHVVASESATEDAKYVSLKEGEIELFLGSEPKVFKPNSSTKGDLRDFLLREPIFIRPLKRKGAK